MRVSSSFTGIICEHCGAYNSGDSRYCAQCGQQLHPAVKMISPFEHPALRSVILFYFMDLSACLSVKAFDYFNDYRHRVWVEISMAAVAVVFAWLNRKDMEPLYSLRTVQWKKILLIIPLTVIASCSIGFIVHRLNIALYGKDGLYYYGYNMLQHPAIAMIISITLYPAIFEEMAFRGFLFNHLGTLFPPRMVIIITSVLFAILHLSLLSLVWLLPLALLLGHLRHRYHTLWYGMIIHFVFNLTACLLELHQLGIL